MAGSTPASASAEAPAVAPRRALATLLRALPAEGRFLQQTLWNMLTAGRLVVELHHPAGKALELGLKPIIIVNKVDRNEYKRRQAPVGVRITRRGFGKDRRYPITNKFRDE